MTAPSAMSRNLCLGLLLATGSLVFLWINWNLPLELAFVGLAGAALLVYLAIRFPEWFLVAAVFAPQWKTFWILQRLNSIVDLTLAMLLCLAAGIIWRTLLQVGRPNSDLRGIFFGQGNPILVFVLFAAIVTASYIYTSAPSYGASKMSRFLTIGALMFIAPFFLILTEQHLRRFARIFVGFSLATAIQLIFTLESGSFDPNSDITRIGAGWLLGMAVILVLFYPLLPSRRGQRALFLVVLPVCVAGLVASAARGPIVALVVSVFIGSVTWLRQGRLRGRTALVLLLLLGIGFTGAFFVLRQASLGKYNAKAEEFKTLLSEGTSGGSAGKRLNFYRATLNAIPDHLLLGAGVGSWATFYWGSDSRNYPHDLFLEIAFEQGLLGLAAFVVFLLLVAAAIFRLLRESRSHFLALGLMVLYCVLVGMFSGDLDDNRVLFLWIGVTLATCSTVRLQLRVRRFPRRLIRRPSDEYSPSPWVPAYSGRGGVGECSFSKRGRAWREKFV
jgi:O-antigen ligase